MKRIIAAISALLLALPSAFAQYDIVLQNEQYRLVLSSEGYAKSLVVLANGQECLKAGEKLPLCSILQYRPYDNENFLMFPAKPMTFPSNKIELAGDCLKVEFQDTYDIAFIKVNMQPDYMGFSLEKIDYRIEDFGVKRKTEIDEFTLLQLPVVEREHFGDWLNVTWDDSAAVCVMGTMPQTRIDSQDEGDWRTMYAAADFKVQLLGVSAALVATPSTETLLDAIDGIEHDYGMPLGVESRRCEQYKYSYYEVRDVTLENVDRHIAYAKKGGFRQMVIYYTDFASTCGHYLWREDRFPGGMDDLKEIVARMHDAGMTVGFHIHYSKVSVDDPYVYGGGEYRYNAASTHTLACDLDETACELITDGKPSGVRMEDGRRLLKIDDEFIFYTDVTDNGFVGLERAALGTVPADHKKGTRFIQPDVDDWPRFIRIDQNSDIQDEIASRLAEIYDTCGFEFIYFDGAEDVPAPYWYNVSKAQYAVWSKLKGKMLFAEGALKSHYGWHILSRGNAFDHFREDKIHRAMDKYNLRAAKQISNDLTAVNFGWLYCDMTPQTYDYVFTKAAEWNCPVSYIAELDKMDACPYIDEILMTIKKYEDAK